MSIFALLSTNFPYFQMLTNLWHQKQEIWRPCWYIVHSWHRCILDCQRDPINVLLLWKLRRNYTMYMFNKIIFLKIILDIESTSKSFYTQYLFMSILWSSCGEFLISVSVFFSLLFFQSTTIVVNTAQVHYSTKHGYKYIYILTVNSLHVLNLKPIIYTHCRLVSTAKLWKQNNYLVHE